MATSPYDAVDRAIIYHLQENARRSITDIAADLDVSDNTVRNRIEKLEAEGVIGGVWRGWPWQSIPPDAHFTADSTPQVTGNTQALWSF